MNSITCVSQLAGPVFSTLLRKNALPVEYLQSSQFHSKTSILCRFPLINKTDSEAKVVGIVDKSSSNANVKPSRMASTCTTSNGHQNGIPGTATKVQTLPDIQFVQKYNPTTNKLEWAEQQEDYDFHQEIARAAYADMLHDYDRNQKYEEALAKAIKKVKAKGSRAVVLDIGTGTGLLSMMAVRYGADEVYACEAFKPMADCAANVINRNGCYARIKLLPKRSTELEVGPGKDMESRANILVTEIYDTELIGEGAIESFNHAHEKLLTEDAMVVPDAAEIYALVVDCPMVCDSNALNSIVCPNGTKITFPLEISDCSGVPSVQDLQLSRLNTSDFRQLGPLTKVFTFVHGKGFQPTPEFRSSQLKFKCDKSGTANAIFTWWIAYMDEEKDIVITMQPTWWKTNTVKALPTWKDHWMQSVYYLPERTPLLEGKEYTLQAYHDEFSMWYQVQNLKNETWEDKPEDILDRPTCSCGAHVALSRSRIGLLNDVNNNRQFFQVLKEKVHANSVCLCVSEGSLLPLMAARLGAKRVYVIEQQIHTAQVISSIVRHNNLDKVIKVINKAPDAVQPEDLDNEKVDIIMGDPYFGSSVLPWNNLYFWYAKEALAWSFRDGISIIPAKATIKAIPVRFTDLHNIKSPVGTVTSFDATNPGYDLLDFDNLVLKAAEMTDDHVDAQPLWEYEGVAVGEKFVIAEINLNSSGTMEVQHPPCDDETFESTPNGIALWVDWTLTDQNVISDDPHVIGPQQEKSLMWDRNTKQGVYFLCQKKVHKRSSIKFSYNVPEGNVQVSLTV